MIYFNQAAAGLPPESVLRAITDHLHAEMAQGAYGALPAVESAVQQVYERVAELLHTEPQHIALTTGNSHGWNSIVTALPWQPGDKVLVAPGEWGGNLAMLHQLQQRHRIEVQTLPCDACGTLNLEALQQQLATDARVRLLALTWIPANGATLYPAEAIGALCAQHGVPYLIDAAQALGHIPVDVQALQCDALTAPGRKWLCGPRGTGLVYVRPQLLARLQPGVVDHRSCPYTAQGPELRRDARVLEQSEHALALRLGLGAALEFAKVGGWPARYAAIAHNARTLRAALRTLPRVQVHDADAQAAACGIVCWSVHGCSAEEVQQWLAVRHIQVAVHHPGFTPLDSQMRSLASVVRTSVQWQTTDAEVQALVQAVQALCTQTG